MSKQLVKMAATARPTLMAAAQEQLVALRAELASLPPAAVLGDGHAELLRLIDDVSANIHVRNAGHCSGCVCVCVALLIHCLLCVYWTVLTS